MLGDGRSKDRGSGGAHCKAEPRHWRMKLKLNIRPTYTTSNIRAVWVFIQAEGRTFAAIRGKQIGNVGAILSLHYSQGLWHLQVRFRGNFEENL